MQQLCREKRFRGLIGSRDTAHTHTHTHTHTYTPPNPLSFIMKEVEMGRGKETQQEEHGERGRGWRDERNNDREGDRDAGQDKRINTDG